ncbi:hypothetical protein ACVIJ6_005572 [Bradyrhizobium sp. USDA 4369]
MSIADLKVRMAYVPGIEILTMGVEAGRGERIPGCGVTR